MPDWGNISDYGGTPASKAPAQSPWQSFVSAITNRDWGQTLDNISSGAMHGSADLVGILEGGLNNPITNPHAAANLAFHPPGNLNDLAALLMGRQTPLANKLQTYVPEEEPQDKGDVYAGRAAEGVVAGSPFGGLGMLSGAGSGVGGQAGRDLTGGSEAGDLAGQLVGGLIPFGPHAITAARGAANIRAGLRQPDIHDALAITAYSESRFNPDAVSPKGAKGEMQVMDATAHKPGHGIRPSDGSPEDTARVGRQLFTALVGKYDGDYGKAWAAYNWGEGHIDKFGDNWYEHAPAETKAYVTKNLRMLGKGGPSAPSGEPGATDVSQAGPEQSPMDVNAAQDQQFINLMAAHNEIKNTPGAAEELARRVENDPEHKQALDDFLKNKISDDEYGKRWGEIVDKHVLSEPDWTDPTIQSNVIPLDTSQMRPSVDSVNRQVSDHISEMEDMVKSGDHDVTPNEVAQLRNEIVAPFEKAGKELPPEIQQHADRLEALYGQVAQDSSHEKFTGYPRENAPANDPLEPHLATPGKTLHEYTDAEWKNLTRYQQKALIDRANEKLFNPKERDPNPPAQSGTFGTRVPEGVNRKPPTKAPEGHDEGTPQPEPKDIPTLKQNRHLIVDKLADAITQTNPMRQEAADALTKERAKRFAAAYKIRASEGGMTGFYKELKALKGTMGKPKFESINHWFNPLEIDHLANMINESDLSMGESIKAKTALNKLLGKDYGEVPTHSEVIALQKALPLKGSIWHQLLQNEEGSLNLPEGRRPPSLLGKLWNTVNAAKTIGDWSDLTKSNATMFLTPGYWKALGTFAKGGLFTEKGYEAARNAIREHPDYHYVKEMKISHTGDTQALGQREEIFKENLLQHVPVLRDVMKSSERVYSGVANIVRDHAALRMIARDRAAGVDVDNPVYLHYAGDLINTMTGRAFFSGSKMGNAFESSMPIISKVLWTPRQYASWAKMTTMAVNPKWWYNASPAMRTQMASGIISLAGWTVANLTIASALGYQIHTNILDPLFGKYKIRDTLYDASAGRGSTLHTVAIAVSRLISGGKGNSRDLKTAGDAVMHWMRTHASPAAALIENQFEGKSVRHPINPVGKTQDWLAKDRSNPILDAATPMSLEGTLDAAGHYGWKDLQTYETGVGEMFGRQATTEKPPRVKANKEFGSDFGKSSFGNIKDFK